MRGGPFDLPIFKAGRLEFTSCLSKRPFPRHVITAQPRSGLPPLLFGVAGAIRRNLDHAHAARPSCGGTRKRPLETRRFRAIRSRLRIRGIILKCPGLSLDRGRERGEEEGKKKEKKDRGAPARLDAPKCVAPGNFERTPIYLERSHTRGRRSLYAPRDSAGRNRPDFSVSPSCRKNAISRRESEGTTQRADTRAAHASANVARGRYLLLKSFDIGVGSESHWD